MAEETPKSDDKALELRRPRDEARPSASLMNRGVVAAAASAAASICGRGLTVNRRVQALLRAERATHCQRLRWAQNNQHLLSTSENVQTLANAALFGALE